MLSVDIETEGLNKYVDRITVACVYDPELCICRSFNFITGVSNNHSIQDGRVIDQQNPTPQELCSQEDFHENPAMIKDFLSELDRADSICTFNGIRFDLPFIIHRFGVPESRYREWFVKTIDYFEVCKLVFSSTCSLDRLLSANGTVQTKTASGLQAIEWAREGRWIDLVEYCMMDAILAYNVSVKHIVKLPLTKRHGNYVCLRNCLQPHTCKDEAEKVNFIVDQ